MSKISSDCLTAYVEKCVAQAPPLSDAMLDRITALLHAAPKTPATPAVQPTEVKDDWDV